MTASMPAPYDHDHENEVVPFATTNFRGESKKFGIKTDDRRRHVYIIGKTGMGKTTLIENMVVHDINSGHGVAYIDPHGDTADKLLDFIPPHRVNDVVYFNPADTAYPVGFNILEVKDENEKHLVAAGLMGVFKKIWEGVWSPRMEYILLNCVLALLDVPGSTMMGIARILSDKEYRKKVVEQIKDPVVKSFWVNEFAGYTDKFASEAVAPVQNKVGQFLSANITRNIVAQTKSTFNLREIMDERKILICNLSKGLVGEDSSRLLGGMIITRLQLAAMERVDMAERDRQDFYLYVDEFQNFATESFANILSEARKYRLNLITAHQYIEQLDETVAAAIFGNVGTIVSFRVGSQDAETLAKEFAPVFTEEDVINLAKYEIYLKLMIDGVASSPFSAVTLPPIARNMGSREKVIGVSRERYAIRREIIEEKVIRWSEYMADKPKERKPKEFGARAGGFRSEGPEFRPAPGSRAAGSFDGKVRFSGHDGAREARSEAPPPKPRLEPPPIPPPEQDLDPAEEIRLAAEKVVKKAAEKAVEQEKADARHEERKPGAAARGMAAQASPPAAPAPPKPLPKLAPPPTPSPPGPLQGMPPRKKRKKKNRNKLEDASRPPHPRREPPTTPPPPPGSAPGAFSGKVRIVREENEEKPNVVLKRPGEEEGRGPTPLPPGQSVRFD